MSRFFIDRPIFASVLGIIIILAGSIMLSDLPVAQYPSITPPTVQVTASYPGANAQILAETVATPIEGQVNGVEGMLYMSSTCSNSGNYTLTVSFEIGTDIDMATVFVQNRVAIALPSLPETVRKIGVKTSKQATNMALIIALTSPNNRYDALYLSNYAALNIRDELSRIDGVGSIALYGAGNYSMRLWLDPQKLKARNLTSQDVVSAIEEQNIQVAAGQIGQPPSPAGQNFQYTINAKGRLSNIEEFKNIIVKTGEDGQFLRIKDIAKVELGGVDYTITSKLNGKLSGLIAVFQLPGTNVLAMADAIRAKMKELSKDFPEGIEYKIPFDTTLFVKSSINEVVETLFIAIILVFFVIYIFLQDFRATLIPAVTIPVSLIGTFAVMGIMGFSINMMTLFGLVLAIGIVVDDAIIVVENTTRNMEEHNMSAKKAAIRAMEEISGPIISTTLVLMAVFIPTAFLGGLTGQLYRQFALTIAVSTVFSAFNALTLSPALCAIFLRPTPTRKNIFFRAFNNVFDGTKSIYLKIVKTAVRRVAFVMFLFFALSALAGYGFISLPTGFFPTEDQGYVISSIQLPDAASSERTEKVVNGYREQVMNIKGVEYVFSIDGLSILTGGIVSNGATLFVVFKPMKERKTKATSMDAIMGQMYGISGQIQEASILTFPPPAIRGLGTAGGFSMQIEDRRNVGFTQLEAIAQEVAGVANGQAGLSQVYTTFSANVPQLFADIDRTKAKKLGVSLISIFTTLQTYLGSTYVNDFTKFGRSYQVKVQAAPSFRSNIEDIKRLEVKNNKGEMVPLGTLVSIHEVFGPQIITRYNMYPAATVNGSSAPGYSSGDALITMEQIANANLPSTMGFDWTGMSFQEKAAGSAVIIFVLAGIFVYLVLCAQYESWTISAGVILVIPLALLGTVAAVFARSMDNNIYTQIGIVLLIALACKNAILIIEFAVDARKDGKGILDAAIEAARTRFRPVLMTSFAFILGVFPLAIASGSGAAGRQALGTAVCGGMLAATVLGVLFIPVFYVLIESFNEWVKPKNRKENG